MAGAQRLPFRSRLRLSIVSVAPSGRRVPPILNPSVMGGAGLLMAMLAPSSARVGVTTSAAAHIDNSAPLILLWVISGCPVANKLLTMNRERPGLLAVLETSNRVLH